MFTNLLFLVGGVALGHYVPWLWTSVIGWVNKQFSDGGL